MRNVQIGSYRVLDDLGSGGMGRVYLAEVVSVTEMMALGSRVALKVIHPHLMESPGFFKRFLREAELGRRVDHANVVRTLDCDALVVEGRQEHFLVMEYVEGQTLRDLLAELGRVPEELCRHIAREVAKGLQAIHVLGVVHRDVKPENVLITKDNVVKVMDLGVARLQDEALRLSRTGTFVGSLEYAAPEQFQAGGRDTDGRSDLHALGTVLYELGGGQHPFRDESPRRVIRRILDETPRRLGEVNPQLSPFLEEVVHTLLAKAPGDRFATAANVAEVLDAGEEGAWWQERARALRQATRRPLRRIRIPRETALYGRDAEVARLRDLFAKVCQGGGQVLLLEGEAGIGKTRLIDEFVTTLHREGEDLNFLFGAYPPGGAATDTGAFTTAYREHFGREGLKTTLQDFLPETPALAAAFAALLRGQGMPEGAEALNRDSLQTVFVHATQGLCAERPTIVLIDDLHFAPDGGLALFAALAHAAPGHRLLLIGTTRPGGEAAWVAELERSTHAARLELPRLGPKDLTLLLTDSFRSARLAERLGFRIAQKSDGNPFFAFEIVRGLREREHITQTSDGTWATSGRIEDLQVPSSVAELVRARLQDVSEKERELLDVAACCGLDFDPDLVAAVVGLPNIPALRALGRLERAHRLVRSQGRRFAFDHYQVQEALYQALSPRLQEEYHAAIAEALETREGAAERATEELEGRLCAGLCEHFVRGGRYERALRYLEPALDYLEQSYANDGALELAERVLGVPRLLKGTTRLPVLNRQARLLDLLGRRDQQELALTEAVRVADESGDAGLRAGAYRRLGWLLLALRRNDEAEVALKRALRLAQEGDERRCEAVATGNLGLLQMRRGHAEDALDMHARHLAIAREIGARASEVYALGNLAATLTELGRFDEARARFEECLPLAREVGSRRDEAVATVNLSRLLCDMGRLGEAYEHAVGALEVCRNIGFRMGAAVASNTVAMLLLHLGRVSEVDPLLDRSRDIAREIASPTVGMSSLMLRAEAHLLRGDLDAALRALEVVRTMAATAGDTGREADLWILHGRVLKAIGGAVHWVPAFHVSLRRAEAIPDPVRQTRARAWLAAEGGEDVASALAHYREEDARFAWIERLEICHLLWRATRDPALLDEANGLLDHLLAHAPAADREGMLERIPLYRDVQQAR